MKSNSGTGEAKSADTARNSEEAIASAREAGLVYVSDTEPGIRRRRRGTQFHYEDSAGERVTDSSILDRIRRLAIPPAYSDVWICRRRNGHLQATGRDARGRKQYRYHPDWSSTRGSGKFDRIVAFGSTLPRLRRRVRRDLTLRGFPRDKVMAMIVVLMTETLVRVGSTEYARSNRSFGLTTLRNQHVKFLGASKARLHFRGKGGQMHDVALDDRRLVKLVRGVQQLPGQSLFQYLDEEGEVQPVDSTRLNDYLERAMGENFTAKDFRTWGGTLSAFQRCAKVPAPDADMSEPERRRVEKDIVREVAAALRNTPAVCRRAYIDPAIFAGWVDGSLHRAAATARGARQWELAALKFLRRARRRVAKSKGGIRRSGKA